MADHDRWGMEGVGDKGLVHTAGALVLVTVASSATYSTWTPLDRWRQWKGFRGGQAQIAE